MTTFRVSAPRSEGTGILKGMPSRDPLHEDPQWFELDLDDPEVDDPEPLDPLPTERHRTVP